MKRQSPRPEPISLELWRLNELSGRGGAIIRDALERGLAIMSESPRSKKRLVLVGDRGDSGKDPADLAREIGRIGVELVSMTWPRNHLVS